MSKRVFQSACKAVCKSDLYFIKPLILAFETSTIPLFFCLKKQLLLSENKNRNKLFTEIAKFDIHTA